MSKYTDWFRGDVEPVRPGVYQREMPITVLFAEWTGHQWLRASKTARGATFATDPSGWQVEKGSFRWRGLAKEPK